ncbi:MAG TPA: TonB-dependent receptor [Vicinamibacteria bacterium]
MRFRAFVFLSACALMAPAAYPQGTPTGTLSGQVVDASGAPLPGATVTAQSPNLQGTRTVTTSANGAYIIALLPPGDYTITVHMSGFNDLKLPARVRVAATENVDARMAVASVTESITVTAQAVSDVTQTAQLVTNFKAELMNNLPTTRTQLAAVDLAPGAHASGPNGARTINGAMSYENQFVINGVVVQDNIRSTPFNLFIEDAIQETSVITAAISAEYGRFAGGVINTITKSGGNTFSGSFRTTFDNDKWISLTPFPNDQRTSKVIPTYEATLGGPVFRDKLWFFGAGRLRNFEETKSTANFTAINYPHTIDQKRGEAKLTYALTPNHTFKGSYGRIWEDEGGNVFGTVLDLQSLVTRSLPQELMSFNYSGILTPKFFLEGQASRRKFSFVNSGATSTDIVAGTLLLDRARGNARYHSPTFCGVCDPERRDNWDALVKASYFLSTDRMGSHNIVGGVDLFNDQRFSNNHQSGSDYRIFGTTSIIQGTNIFPVFNNDASTFIRWTPIFESSQGNNFHTNSAFVNDIWRLNDHVTFNLGARYDKNDGKDSIGRVVIKDSAFSPRLSATFDPKGNGEWTFNAAYAKYVTAIANSVGDSSSPGGQPGTIDFDYLGPAINVDPSAPLVSQDDAIRRVFDWFNANGGTNRTTRGAPSIPGLTSQINDRLASPNVTEYTAGGTRRLGSRGLVRIDGIYRKFRDFYVTRTDLSTGRVTDSTGKIFDLAVVENTNLLDRHYKGINAQISYRAGSRLNLGGNYTLSQARGNWEGENGGSGPVTSAILFYPEYRDRRWNLSTGDLLIDQRHRGRAWATYDLPISERLGSLNVGLLETYQSGIPYGANGSVDTRPFVTNPGYVNPPATVTYWFQPQGAFHTEASKATDVALNYSRRIGVKKTELFFRGLLFNVFNEKKLANFAFADCGTGGCINTAVLTRNNNAARFAAFNPFTETPVQGVNWDYGPDFGKPTSRFAYQRPRTLSLSVGVRF